MSTSQAATVIPCPDPATLAKLLRDELSPTEAGPVEEHVGACPGCQRELQRLLGSLPDTLAPAAGPPGEPADKEPPDLPGYEALGRIGAGGMGVVWRVRDLEFRRTLSTRIRRIASAAAAKKWARPCHSRAAPSGEVPTRRR